MATPAPPADADAAIKAILANLGAGNQQSSADDPPIYYGTAPDPAGNRLVGGEPVKTAVPVTKSLSEYSKQFYSLDKNALIQFQHRAQAAGMYGNSRPRFGDYDDDTYKLWQDVGVRAARFYAAGQDFTVNDVLDMAAQSTAESDKQAQVYGTRTDVVNLQDPATIRGAAHAAFKSVTGKGRATDDAKVRKFVDAFTAAQANAQRTVNQAQDRAEATTRAAQESGGASGPMSQEVDLTMPDLGSRASEFAASEDAAGAGATKVADKFGAFVKMLGGIV